MPTLALYKETEQNRMLEISRMHSTIRIILVDRLFLDDTKISPLLKTKII
jgi:hypothetical protein